MKNIELWSREMDHKIAVAAAVFGVLVLAGVMGLFLPLPEPIGWMDDIAPLMTVGLLGFAWAGFRVVRPYPYNRKWVAAELIAVPMVWLLLVGVLFLWLWHLNQDWAEAQRCLEQFNALGVL
ncbi:MAG TPA: hypothetical protein VL527_06355 [Dongiaceae bacterium]|jgi:hypothetical protein|nr:hypothetical protein [Dongiaceae bacterium]